MLGILIAAGRGQRLKSITTQTPKCLLKMNAAGRTILAQTLENFTAAGCNEFIIITGHAYEAFQRVDLPKNIRFLHNADYMNNNILHSLMTARDYFDRPLLISYSDIWVEPFIYEQVLNTQGEAVLAVDAQWQDYYQGRDEHPVEQAEKVLYQQSNNQEKVLALGKILPNSAQDLTTSDCKQGEFIGVMKLSATAAQQFRDDFLALDKKLAPDNAPFQQAASWKQAYLTDLMQYQIEQGASYTAAVVDKGWAEFDTVQDYQRLPITAKNQKLDSLINPYPVLLDAS